jgi:hypothetical protein
MSIGGVVAVMAPDGGRKGKSSTSLSSKSNSAGWEAKLHWSPRRGL